MTCDGLAPASSKTAFKLQITWWVSASIFPFPTSKPLDGSNGI